jgi:drug/metabolite transporter (DMT)-like permease
MQRDTRTGYLLSISAALVWAITSPAIKYLLETHHVPALAIAFWRDALIALACLTVMALARPALLRVSLRDLRGLAIVGAISIGVYHALWVLSIVLNGAAVAVVMIYTFPIFVTLGAWLLFGERIGWPQVLALGCALLGCALLVRAYDPAVLRVSWLGTLVGLATGMTHAGYVLYSQHAVATKSPWTSLAYTMLFGALMLLVLWLVSGALGLAPSGTTSNIVRAVGGTSAPWLVLLALALGYLPYKLYLRSGLVQYVSLRGELAALTARNEQLQSSIRELRHQLERMKEDPAAIERVARDELGMVRSGEVVFKVE